MSELKKNGLEQLSDETLSQVAGGMSRTTNTVSAKSAADAWRLRATTTGKSSTSSTALPMAMTRLPRT